LSNEEGTVTFQGLNRAFAVGLLLLGGWAATSAPLTWGQEIKGQETNRKVKNKVPPAYPELARRMNITGVVKVRVTVAPNGSVKDATLVGGHPVLANAALEAVKKWRFEARPDETSETVEFRFDSAQ
jgi:TonB family protein